MNGHGRASTVIKGTPRSMLLKKHRAQLKAQETDENAARPVKQPVPDDAYPASTRSARDLEKIAISELKAETHHRGFVAIVKTITAPYRGAGTVTIVEDEFGNVERITIYNQSDASILSNVPEGCFIAVKEPYYQKTSETDHMICVDHPSDVILLRFNDPIVPDTFRSGAENVMNKSSAEWRSAGDASFIQRDFPTAVFCYTEALESASTEDTASKASIFAKRAGTNLMLCRYDAAKEDALASRTGAPGDWKAYMTAAKAAYGLCEYRVSREYFDAALEKNAKAPGVQRERERCLARLREEGEGSYDFCAMYESLSPQHVHLDSASFFANTRIATSAHHGRGVFATRPIKAGELIFCEKATIMPNQYEPPRASAALYAMMVRLLHDNPSLEHSAVDLYAGDMPRTGREGTLIDGVPVTDVYLLESIRLRNCFSSPLSTVDSTRSTGAESGRMAKGLWVGAAYMNHSCVASSMRSFLGDMLVSRAVRDIAAGEEIFQHYVPVKASLAQRQEQFREVWGFECACALCEGEARSPAAMHEKRTALLMQVEKVAAKRPATGIVPDAAIRTVDRLARQLEESHEADVYESLPRLALIYPCMWLVRAHRGRKNHAKVVLYAWKVLRNFGFFVPMQDGAMVGVWDILRQSHPKSLMTIHVVSVLKFAGEAYRAMGQAELADQCQEAAKFGYMIMTGFENDLEGIAE